MHVFTIRDIENLTGIKAHTLRIWEQRYQLMVPSRGGGQHRTYSNDDLKQLLKISTLYHNGFKISRIAALNKDEIDRQALNTFVLNDPYGLYVNQLMEASIDFDEPRFDQILHTCILHYAFERTVLKILFPFLNKMGLLWMTGNVVPAMEHFASALVRKKILVELNTLRPSESKSNATVALFTPEQERHELPILMMQYLLKQSGIRHVLLGQCVSSDTLDVYCKARPVTHLYAHVITYLQRPDIEEYVAGLSSQFHDKQIVLSGSVVQSLQRNFTNVRILKTPEEMLDFPEQLKGEK